jgi:hypothetical protein
MAIAMVDGPAVLAQLEGLGISITDFAAYCRMQRSDVSRALHGHPQEPGTLFRLAQGLDELRRERDRNGRARTTTFARSRRELARGRGAAGVISAGTLRLPLDDKADIFTGEVEERFHDVQLALAKDPELLDHAQRVISEAMDQVIAHSSAARQHKGRS